MRAYASIRGRRSTCQESDATASVSQDIVSAQLRANELADYPAQRNGALRGQTVFVDTRVLNAQGDPIGTTIANVTGEIALVPQTIQQRTSAGGSIVLDSTGDVVVAPGATLNVSGGKTTYSGAWIQTTKLVTANGTLVDIGNADPLQTYVGVVNPSVQAVSNRWGVVSEIPTPGLATYDPGYVEGSAGGTVQVLGRALALSGNFIGQTVSGPYQRVGDARVSGATFIVGDPANSLQNGDFRAGAVELVVAATPVAVGDDSPYPPPQTLQLPAQSLFDHGFSTLSIASNDHITLDPGTPLVLPAGGALDLIAPRVSVDSSIDAPGGKVSVSGAPGLFGTPAPIYQPGVYVANGVVLDVRGDWTNDVSLTPKPLPTTPIYADGGSISLKQSNLDGTLTIGSDVRLELSGGGALSSAGKLTSGNGGTLTLAAGPQGTVDLGSQIALDAFGLQGGEGGTFSLSASRISIASGGASWALAQTLLPDPASGTALHIDATLFDKYGFQTTSLTADGPSCRPIRGARACGSSTALRSRWRHPSTYCP